VKQFKIYENPQGNFEAVKIGFCWPGFFFGAIWALFCKMWKLGLGIMGVAVLLGFIGSGVSIEAAKTVELITNLFSIGVSFALGFKGNELREGDLLSKGYELKGTELFGNKDGAIAQYIKSKE